MKSLTILLPSSDHHQSSSADLVVLIASPAVDVLSSCDDGLRDLTLQTHRQATLPVGRQDRLVHRRVVGHDGHDLLEELVSFPVQTASRLDNER
mgnify:CR=1 FL=1